MNKYVIYTHILYIFMYVLIAVKESVSSSQVIKKFKKHNKC